MKEIIKAKVKLTTPGVEGFYGHLFVEFSNEELHHIDYKTAYDFKKGDEIKIESSGSILNTNYTMISPFKEKLKVL